MRWLAPPLDVAQVALVALAAIAASAAGTAPAAATDFYVDPVNGSPAGNGSADDPWRTLEEVVAADLIETRHWASLPYLPGATLAVVNAGAPVRAGDTIWLRSGYHGELFLRGAYNAAPITVAAAPGEVPRLRRVWLSAAQNWIVRGLSISPSHAPGPLTQDTMVFVENHGWHGPSWDIEIADCDLFTVDDASSWGESEWVNDAASAFRIDGDRVTARGNRVRNVRFGISVSGKDARIRDNLVDGFSADGLRGLGDGGRFEYNTIQNALVGAPADGNHDDGFQSWSVGPGGVGTGEVRDVVLRGNRIVNNLNPDHPLHATLQGIGCFDGLFVNWVVENNVVVTDHWHGISLYGAIGGRIVNNTVLDLNGLSPGPPWIMLNSSNGTPSSGVLVRNNLATDYAISGTGIVQDHNVEITNPASLFVAPPFDLQLKAGSPAIDAGSAAGAPALDMDRVARPQGAAHDLGAYERCPACLFHDGFELGDDRAWGAAELP
ncbi:MAG: right-handed parallel beta-helix repeat-containing protein [Thermoanaerobaculia bacterium]|nr:right-handed parallel beta-helix repeat-containing protein [Thermoanaerobaculia bacterium]